MLTSRDSSSNGHRCGQTNQPTPARRSDSGAGNVQLLTFGARSTGAKKLQVQLVHAGDPWPLTLTHPHRADDLHARAWITITSKAK